MAMQAKTTVKQISRTTSEASARTHKSLVDRPEAKGGTDRGPMGGELLLMGVGGCFMSGLLAEVRGRELPIDDLAIDVTGVFDGAPPRFTEVEMAISSKYPDRAVLQGIIDAAGQACLAANTIKEAAKLTVVLTPA